jgi:CheY-like chemotaxis protein
MRILIIDERFQSRATIAHELTGFFGPGAVESAGSARDALAAVAKRMPDLVLAAHPMRSMGGIGLTRLLKSKDNPPVVVVMTELSDAQFESACDAAGADFWLEKRHLEVKLPAFLQRRFGLTVPPARPA